MRTIPLSRGYVALVDDDDYEKAISAGPWHATVPKRGLIYGRRATGQPRYLHTLLTGWAYVDHRDGDGLNNQRENLRPASHSQNMANRRMPHTNSSGYKGVSWQKTPGLWKAYIRASGKQCHLGVFATAEDAARAYDAAARLLHGEFAHLNFPDG